jgi:hypothetical protein
MKNRYKHFFKEDGYPQVEIGDEVLGGKFKNKKMIVKDFGTDENHQPTIKTDKGEKKLYAVRIPVKEKNSRYNSFFKEEILLEWIDDIRANKNSLLSELEVMYEWEYKYSMLSQSSDMSIEKRIDNILLTIRKRLNPILNSIIEKLSEVFENWLENHALLSPNTWAKARYKEIEYLGETNDILESIKDEYDRYGSNNFYEEIFQKLFKYFLRTLEQLRNEYINDKELELEGMEDNDGDVDDIKYLKQDIKELKAIKSKDDWKEFIESWYESIESFILQNITDEQLILVYEKVVFPEWFAYWKEEGIEKTRNRVEKTYKDLISAVHEESIQKKVMYINIALNESHQTGSMVDYIEQKWDVSQRDLDNLSGIGPSTLASWNKEIQMAL